LTTIPPIPLCSFCSKPVEVETAKTDKNGKAIHEHCYFLKMLAAAPPGAQEVE